MTTNLFQGVFRNRRVLVTGHTGFKGSWLSLWLVKLGANVIGYSLPAPTKPNHFELLNLPMISLTGDIRDKENFNRAVKKYRPEIIFHLAAQSLVRCSYRRPVETFETNVLGTVNILDACRNANSVKAVVNVTSDKCYENRTAPRRGYRETDRLGGYDPYSASKACAEIVTGAYRNAFFDERPRRLLLASCRAGNVVGGGDWAEDRLIPDIIRAVSRGQEALIRYPKSIRPWQHVLDALSGYLVVGQKLLAGHRDCAEAWNFGPTKSTLSVETAVKLIQSCWNKVNYRVAAGGVENGFRETTRLLLDCSKARRRLHWQPVWNTQKTFEMTAGWYRNYLGEKQCPPSERSELDLSEYLADGRRKKIVWART